MWNRLVEGGPADLDALGGQQAAVAVVTEQDQFLTLCSQTLQTPISADGQPDDLHTRTRGQMDLCEQKPSESCVTFDPNQAADIPEKWHWVGLREIDKQRSIFSFYGRTVKTFDIVLKSPMQTNMHFVLL